VQERALRRLIVAVVALCVLFIIGTGGYIWLEQMTFIDAAYMAVITISTVGFGEVETLGSNGRIFTILLIIGGGGIAAYSLSAAAEFFLSGEWRVHLDQQRRKQMISRLNNHTIVCGYGRMGHHVVDELRAQQLPFIVIEPDAAKIAEIHAAGDPALQGDAANEELLLEAGIERASGIVVVANSDAENVFITLTARHLRPDIIIVARANDDGSESKLHRAGADRVLLPYRTFGRRLVTLLIRPDVGDFLDEVIYASDLELLVEQVQIAPSSPLVGRTLGEAALRADFGVTVLAYREARHALRHSPSASTMLHAGGQLIVLGTPDQLQKLSEVAQDTS
jgi:voltage-gated potassium channel